MMHSVGETIRDSAANRAAPSSNASPSFSQRQLLNSPSPLHRSVAICTGVSAQKPIAAVRQRRAIVSACDFAFRCMDCVYFTEWC